MPFDPDKYPPGWTSVIVPRIRARAGEVRSEDGKSIQTPPRCEFCGAADREVGYHNVAGDHFFGFQEIDDALHTGHDHFAHELKGIDIEKPPIRIILTVAYLDHDETNWDVTDDRLACLCAPCHLGYDRKNNWLRRKTNVLVRVRRQLALFPSLMPCPSTATPTPASSNAPVIPRHH